MATLRFGTAAFGFEPLHEVLALVQTAESLGFEHAWTGDSQILTREVYVTLGALAVQTHSILLGCSVTHPQTRHVTVQASAWSSVAELSGGRAVVGIGLGDGAVETIGVRPARLAELEVAIDQMRRLMRGETLELDGHSVRLNHAWGREIPFYVAASGPRMLDLTGRLGDGAILLNGTHPELVRAAIAKVEAGAVSAGRRLEDVDVVLWCPFSIDADGEVARSRVRTHVARAVRHPQPFEFDEEDRAVIARINERYDYYKHLNQGSPQAEEVPKRLVEKFAIAGTPEECGEQVERLVSSGLPIGEVALVPHGPDKAGQLRLFASEVMARL